MDVWWAQSKLLSERWQELSVILGVIHVQEKESKSYMDTVFDSEASPPPLLVHCPQTSPLWNLTTRTIIIPQLLEPNLKMWGDVLSADWLWFLHRWVEWGVTGAFRRPLMASGFLSRDHSMAPITCHWRNQKVVSALGIHHKDLYHASCSDETQEFP